MRCPGCGIEIKEPKKFCSSCGARLIQRMCPNGHILKDREDTCLQCATQGVQKVKTVAPVDKGKTLFEINTVAPSAEQKNEEIREFPFEKGDVRRTKVVKTDSTRSDLSLAGWLVSFYRRPEGEDFRIFRCENVVGASPVCNVRIDEESISSRHAVISYRDGNFYLKDLGSTNGTYLNGIRLDGERLINDGDSITFGVFRCVFCRLKRE